MEQTNTHTAKRLSIHISGKVQGVGFRYFIKEAAQRYHINGWVKNMGNGDVLIEAQGEENLLKRFTQDVEIGPRASHVEELNIQEIPTKDQERSFSIRISEQSSQPKTDQPS